MAKCRGSNSCVMPTLANGCCREHQWVADKYATYPISVGSSLGDGAQRVSVLDRKELKLTFKPRITTEPSKLSPGTSTWVFHCPDGTTRVFGNRSLVARGPATEAYLKMLAKDFRHLGDPSDVTVIESSPGGSALDPDEAIIRHHDSTAVIIPKFVFSPPALPPPAWIQMRDWLNDQPAGAYSFEDIAAAVGKHKTTLYQAAQTHQKIFIMPVAKYVALRSTWPGETALEKKVSENDKPSQELPHDDVVDNMVLCRMPPGATPELPAVKCVKCGAGIPGDPPYTSHGRPICSQACAYAGLPRAADPPVRGKSTLVPDSEEQFRTVQLSGGGFVTLMISADLFSLRPADREIVFGMIDLFTLAEEKSANNSTEK